MSHNINFEGSSEIGAYSLLTNTYAIIGKSSSRNFYSSFQEVLDTGNIKESTHTFPLVETLINTIPNVGAHCQGNKNGLLLPHTTTDQELSHIRNSLPEKVKIRRLREKLNALGNVILSNDRIALVHQDLNDESVESIIDTLNVEVVKQSLGTEFLVGTFAALNSVGMLCHPIVSVEEMEELSRLLEVQVVAGTVNRGSPMIGGGIAVNDWVSFVGHKTTTHERTVIESVFKITKEIDEEARKKALIECFIN